jgi:serine/threonine protein kinase/DNA-binding beta-propeller fold protein YncE
MNPPVASDKTLTQIPGLPIADETLAQSADSIRRSAELSANDPRRVPGYDLFDEVGRGGMGIVYRAFDQSMNREVAVKILSEKYEANSSHAVRFNEEAQITGQLQHPGIPAVYHVGRLESGRPFLAMKLIKGHTLDDLLKQKSPINSLAIFESISQAVGYAHSYGVIHRDLKPANIMVGAFGEVQVMDWGLAKVLAKPETQSPGDSPPDAEIKSLRNSDSSFTQAGSVMGTPAFMPPEQAAGQIDRIDARGDVFGLGAILCVMLTGQPPYEGTSAESVLLNAVGGKMDAALARLDSCEAEPEIVNLCKRCLSFEPSHRPANAERLAEEIASLRRESDERAKKAELAKHEADVRSAEELKRRRVWLALAALLIIGTATSVVLAIQSYRARKDAEKAHADTRKQKAIAERQLTRAEWLVYANSIDDAQRHWMDNRPEMAMDELNECRIDFRGWEHDYLFTKSILSQLPSLKHIEPMRCVTISPDGKWILSSLGHSIKLWESETGQTGPNLDGHRGAVRCIAVTPNGKRIISGSDDRTIRIWDAGTFESIHELTGHNGPVLALAFNSEGTRLISGSQDRTLFVWDLATQKILAELKGHADAVNGIAFTTDGKRIISASDDRTVRIWDAESFQLIAELKGHKDRVTAVAVSPSGRWIASSSADRMVRIWDAESLALVTVLKGHSDAVNDVAFSPDGKRLLSASTDKELWLWETEHWSSIAGLKGHTGPVNNARFSPDGKTIVSASDDRTVRIWRATFSQPTTPLVGCTTAIAVAFSPDGTQIWAKDAAGQRYAWILATGQPVTDEEPIPDIPEATEAVSPDQSQRVRIVNGVVELRDEAKWAKVAKVKRPGGE